MLDLDLLFAGEKVFAIQSAYTSPEGSCPFFQLGPSPFCMLLKVICDPNNPKGNCEGIHYQNGIICLRISQFLFAKTLYIPEIGIS